MSAALTLLKKLRKYELEAEEHRLQLKQREENKSHQAFTFAQRTLQEALITKASLPLTPQWIRLEAYLREADQHQDAANLQWKVSRTERDQQMERTLYAKQRLEMMERLLERRREEANLIQEAKERKQLDDITQSRFISQPTMAP